MTHQTCKWRNLMDEYWTQWCRTLIYWKFYLYRNNFRGVYSYHIMRNKQNYSLYLGNGDIRIGNRFPHYWPCINEVGRSPVDPQKTRKNVALTSFGKHWLCYSNNSRVDVDLRRRGIHRTSRKWAVCSMYCNTSHLPSLLTGSSLYRYHIAPSYSQLNESQNGQRPSFCCPYSTRPYVAS